VQKIEHKAVDQFDSMTDDELRQYVYGDKDLESDYELSTNSLPLLAEIAE
jgi:hypothetical protein